MSLEQDSKEELLDVVDENNQVVGQELRSVICATNQRHTVRAVWLFLINKEGKLWIPRRAATKKSLPLHLDGSVVGCVSAGETYEQAVEREAHEEINMDITGKYKFIEYINPSEGDTECHVQVYTMNCEKTPDYSLDEFCEDFWMTPQEILAKSNQNYKMKSSLPHLVKRFFVKK